MARLAFHWSRPVRNGPVRRRRPAPSWEPPVWLGGLLLAVFGWLFSVILLSF